MHCTGKSETSKNAFSSLQIGLLSEGVLSAGCITEVNLYVTFVVFFLFIFWQALFIPGINMHLEWPDLRLSVHTCHSNMSPHALLMTSGRRLLVIFCISLFTLWWRKRGSRYQVMQVLYTVWLDLMRAQCRPQGVKESLHYWDCARDKPNSDSSRQSL